MESAGAASFLAWGACGAPLIEPSGDRHVVIARARRATIAVIDGLGHGPEAAEASARAAHLVEAHAGESPIAILERCHEGLRETRGVAMTVVALDDDASAATWAGVGNVECVLVRADGSGREGAPLRGGVVGYRMPPLRERTLPLRPFDTLALATDGIGSGFVSEIDAARAPAALADAILAKHGKRTDDALVLVARYLGGEP